MKKIKFKELEVGKTFYKLSDYGRIDQYEKLNGNYAEQIMTVSSVFIEDDEEIYID